uniref:Uncharacterized protein n=1 Tax=Oryza rufipogon TaxID=4529 RepID=A0A0E0Q0C6_ORYRU
MALTTRLMALTGLPLDMDVETKSASAIHACAIDLWKGPLFATPSASLVLRELVHEQANDLNDDDMDTTEAGIGMNQTRSLLMSTKSDMEQAVD